LRDLRMGAWTRGGSRREGRYDHEQGADSKNTGRGGARPALPDSRLYERLPERAGGP
jgi:hypothetical protein